MDVLFTFPIISLMSAQMEAQYPKELILISQQTV